MLAVLDCKANSSWTARWHHAVAERRSRGQPPALLATAHQSHYRPSTALDR